MFVWGRNIYLVQLLSAATPGMTSPVRKRVPVGQICNRLQDQMDSETGTTSTPLSPIQYHIKSLHIISRHYKKSLLSKKSNIPWIWRIIYGHKLPYMKKTRKKKQVCGAACFMAAEIKFSKDVRLSVCLSHLFDYVPIIVSSRNFQELLPMTEVMSMQKVKVKGQGHRGHNPT